MVTLMQRRGDMMQISQAPPVVRVLLDQGTLSFNLYTITITDRAISANKSGSGSDAYGKTRNFNISNFTANTTTGLDHLDDITNQPKITTIPGGASCVFSLSGSSIWVSASYAYYLIQLIDTNSNVIAQLGIGNNVPSGIGLTKSWTQTSNVDIGCIAIRAYHTYQNNNFNGTLSLTIDGIEILPG